MTAALANCLLSSHVSPIRQVDQIQQVLKCKKMKSLAVKCKQMIVQIMSVSLCWWPITLNYFISRLVVLYTSIKRNTDAKPVEKKNNNLLCIKSRFFFSVIKKFRVLALSFSQWVIMHTCDSLLARNMWPNCSHIDSICMFSVKKVGNVWKRTTLDWARKDWNEFKWGREGLPDYICS